MLLVAPNVRAATVAELVALLKSQPGRFNYGSSGNGTIVHLTGELFKSMTGTFVVHIPYRGTALVIPDMVSGQIHLMFDNIASAMPHLKDGRVRALAVTSLQRSSLLPQLPTVADAVPGFESTTWFGVFGPRGMPADAVQRLNSEINAVLKSPEFIERLKTLGYDAAGGTPQKFAQVVSADAAKWARLIRERKISQIYSQLQTGNREGMNTLEQCLIKLMQDGKISQQEAISKASNPKMVLEAGNAVPA